MFGTNRNPTAIYAEVSSNAADSADPHKLILMLFDGARMAISTARLHMEHKEIPEKGAAISRAIDIIQNGLNASLDETYGGELAVQLSALYEYINQRLLWANLKNNVAALDEASQLLGELQSAWIQIAPNPPTQEDAA